MGCVPSKTDKATNRGRRQEPLNSSTRDQEMPEMTTNINLNQLDFEESQLFASLATPREWKQASNTPDSVSDEQQIPAASEDSILQEPRVPMLVDGVMRGEGFTQQPQQALPLTPLQIEEMDLAMMISGPTHTMTAMDVQKSGPSNANARMEVDEEEEEDIQHLWQKTSWATNYGELEFTGNDSMLDAIQLESNDRDIFLERQGEEARNRISEIQNKLQYGTSSVEDEDEMLVVIPDWDRASKSSNQQGSGKSQSKSASSHKSQNKGKASTSYPSISKLGLQQISV